MLLLSKRMEQTMETAFIKSLNMKGFLSYGPNAVEIPLGPLNVLIGPNGSGKSNLVEAISILRAVPKDLPLPIRKGGSVRDWLWKGTEEADFARLEIIVAEDRVVSGKSVRYRLDFGVEGDSFTVLEERLENEQGTKTRSKPFFYYGIENGRPMINVNKDKRELRREDLNPVQSILSQRRDPDSYPEITRLADLLGKIQIYRDWSFGVDSVIRQSCGVERPADTLSEALDNLPLRLQTLKRDPKVKRAMIEKLRQFAPGFDDLEVIPEGGSLRLFLTEGTRNFPARRLSDGTLRYLALLAILLDPAPAPLIVIEEPELGLHFDMMPELVSLLKEASTKTQLIVTTHSDVLIDALSDTPESVVVCEKDEAGTHLRRLEPSLVKESLEAGSLGSLWTRGDIGGTRW